MDGSYERNRCFAAPGDTHFPKAVCLRPIGHRLMQVLFPHLAYITLFLLFSSVKLATLCNGTKVSQLPVASTFFLTKLKGEAFSQFHFRN